MSEVVVVTFRAKEGKEQEVEEGLAALAEPTHREGGCIRYALHRGTDDPRSFALVERWASREALESHFQQPHMKQMPDPEQVLDGPPEILFCEPVPAGDPKKGTL